MVTLSGRFEGTFKLANLEQLGITEHTEHTLNAEVCTSLQYFVLNDAFQLLVFILSYCVGQCKGPSMVTAAFSFDM